MKPAPQGPKIEASCDLSVVLPCYNGAALIQASVDELSGYLEARGIQWEIIVVNDGSTDGSRQVLERMNRAQVRAIHLERNTGKGRAIAAGVEAAKGDSIVFTDIDLPYSLDGLGSCYDILAGGRHQAVFGNRKLVESKLETEVAWTRRLFSSSFSRLAGFTIGRQDLDTQCGLKGFSRGLAKQAFERLKVGGFAFDVELCLLLSSAGVEIASVPVRLVHQGTSTVKFWRYAPGILLDLAAIWRRKLLRQYDGLIPRVGYAKGNPG